MKSDDTPHPLSRFVPDGIVGRFGLLLVAVLLAVNVITTLLLAREGTSWDRQIRIERDLGRLVSLVTALEVVNEHDASTILRQSSTGYTRFHLADAPLAPPEAIPDPEIAKLIAQALPGYDIRAVVGEDADTGDRPVLLMVSVRLVGGAYADRWLTSLVYPLRTTSAWRSKATFFVPLGLSLIATLGVGLLSIRKMTQPMRDLAKAARAAGHGDRSVRVPEAGAREIRDAATAFNDMQRQIENHDKERMRVVAAIGHDLRTPITGLRMRVEMLNSAARREPMLAIIDTITVMADDLLHFGTGNQTGEPMVPTDMTALVAQLCARPGVTMVPSTATVVAVVRRVAISRAIGNLIDNALRYAGMARVSVMRSASWIIIAVEDEGPGIPPEQMEEIVEPFVRGDDSRCEATGGAGLGLAIARSIAQAHDGTLVLSERAGGGLRAEVRLASAWC